MLRCHEMMCNSGSRPQYYRRFRLSVPIHHENKRRSKCLHSRSFQEDNGLLMQFSAWVAGKALLMERCPTLVRSHEKWRLGASGTDALWYLYISTTKWKWNPLCSVKTRPPPPDLEAKPLNPVSHPEFSSSKRPSDAKTKKKKRERWLGSCLFLFRWSCFLEDGDPGHEARPNSHGKTNIWTTMWSYEVMEEY